MTAGNNRKENKFRQQVPELEIVEPIPSIVEDTEEKKSKGSPKKQDTKPKNKETKPQQPKVKKPAKAQSRDYSRIRRAIGILFICLAVFLGFALISYLVSFFSGHHQEWGYQIFSQKVDISNRTGRVGVFLGQTLIKESFGLGAFFFVYLLTAIGLWLTDNGRIKMWSLWKYALLCLVWIPMFFGFIALSVPQCAIFGGAVGLWLNTVLVNYIGKVGTLLILILLFLIFAIYQFNLTFNHIKQLREQRIEEQRRQDAIIAEQRIMDEIEKSRKGGSVDYTDFSADPDDEDDEETESDNYAENRIRENVIIHNIDEQDTTDESQQEETTTDTTSTGNPIADSEVTLVIEQTQEEETVNKIERHTIDTPFDPHYELRDFKFPTLDMLNEYGDKKSEINEAELQANKNKIVETLANYGIAIEKIKATIGPTVTLYEIVPAAGIRISKIKNLEDDIALSLAALGIRIIAPIPGKGTIGIEVPNSKPETVSMKSVLASEKFQNNKYALPCAIGKTISNETYVFDLAKMPHILMAGATGQGKSVGLNAIIASLLYSKHPSELKFVMVDPKKVELTLYNRIERHYLAKLPDTEDAIITDVKQVVRTLNSLCIEMDQRYDLLKQAECRNIIEYNEKFKARRLLPTEGHRFLPYIVLIVDEFADLIMTAGREVESPIARLAQLARAIGIHLIIATQRPSVNIITGSIKANFPARIAFRVISQVDSKTILDQSGANQLIGRGDMLLSTGNDLVRLQCAFIDTPEVEAVTEYIGAQRGYAEPFLLPEVPEEEGEGVDIDDEGERDSLFEEAARIVVQTQQGSTSMIQRKLKLGYNRAGRIIDQLEAAGIVGAFSGSKSREVKIKDEFALEQILRDIYNKDNGI
jgi:S-DNA-T family DNA segregation ATPase FtsK/SpoIIIE